MQCPRKESQGQPQSGVAEGKTVNDHPRPCREYSVGPGPGYWKLAGYEKSAESRRTHKTDDRGHSYPEKKTDRGRPPQKREFSS